MFLTQWFLKKKTELIISNTGELLCGNLSGTFSMYIQYYYFIHYIIYYFVVNIIWLFIYLCYIIFYKFFIFRNPNIMIECLVPDFRGSADHVKTIVESGLDVFAHNVETVEKLTPYVRDRRANYR